MINPDPYIIQGALVYRECIEPLGGIRSKRRQIASDPARKRS